MGLTNSDCGKGFDDCDAREAILLIFAVPLVVFYRPLIKGVWQRAEAERSAGVLPVALLRLATCFGVKPALRVHPANRAAPVRARRPGGRENEAQVWRLAVRSATRGWQPDVGSRPGVTQAAVKWRTNMT